MGRPDASVVMIVRNDERHVAEQLTALAAQEASVPWELIVVDDGSTDRTAEIVAGHLPAFDAARVVHRGSGHSVGSARNCGAAAARGELLLFCDSDDRVAPGWIEAFVARLSAPDRPDGAGGRLDLESLNEVDAVVARPELTTDGLPRFCGHPFAYGGCSAWRAAAFSRLGGYRDLLAAGSGEDVDIALRAERLGFRLVDCPDAVIAYRLRGDAHAIGRQYRSYERSLALVWRAHFERPPLRWWARRTAERTAWLLRHLPDATAAGDEQHLWWMRAGVLAGTVEGSLRARAPYGGARPRPVERSHPSDRALVDDSAIRHLHADAPEGRSTPADRARLEVSRASRLARTWRHGAAMPRRSDPLLILCQPRTGSTLVFEILNRTPGCSVASEVLHRRLTIGPPPIPSAAGALTHLELTLRARGAPVVGAKLHLEQLAHQHLTPSHLLARFPGARLVVLYRASLLEQHVSMLTAKQTGQWRLDPSAAPAPPTTVTVDRDELVAFCDVQRARYRRALDDPAVLAASTLVRYEDLAADPTGVLRGALAALDLDLELPSVAADDAPIRRQSSGSVLDRIRDPGDLDPDDPLWHLDLAQHAAAARRPPS